MSFLNPSALWSLLSIIPLVILYFLKVRPSKKTTTTLFLWEQIFEEKKQNGFLKNFRELLSLILILLSFIFIVFAIARPSLSSDDEKSDLVLIIDNSASMGTVINGTNRLSKAINVAKNIIRNLSPSQQAVIAVANKEVRIKTNISSNQRELLEGIDSIELTEFPLKIELIGSLSNNSDILSKSRFIFISDGCGLSKGALADIELLKVGEKSNNIGIVTFDMIDNPAEENIGAMFFQLASSYEEEKNIELYLTNETRDNVIKVIPLTVKPGINPPVVMNFEKRVCLNWFLTIEDVDALEIDNVAFAIFNKAEPLKIDLTVSTTEPFFLRCIEAFSRSGGIMRLDLEPKDINICHGKVDSSDVPKLIFAPSGQSPFWKSLGGKLNAPFPKIITPDHPMVKFTNWETLSFEGARKIIPPDNSVVLIESDDGVPLLYKTTINGVSAVVVNISPSESQLYFNVNFPIMVYTLATALADREFNQTFNLKMSDSISLKNRNLLVIENGETTLKKMTSQEFMPEKTGFYNFLTMDKNVESFAVSLANAKESLVNDSLEVNDLPAIQSEFPLTDLLIILALILISVECILYHQRKVG